MSDENRLIDQYKAGGKEQFSTLIGPYLHSLRLTAYAILQNEADMEEVVQEAVLKAFTHLTQLRAGESFKAWLLQIAANEARLRLRKDRKHLFTSVEQEIDQRPFQPRQFVDWRNLPSEELERKELRSALTNALSCLNQSYRQVFVLRDIEHLSAVETGAILGLSEAAVNTRLHRARLQMREYITPLFQRPQRRWMTMRFSMMSLLGKVLRDKTFTCRHMVSEISKYVDGQVTKQLRAQIEEHLSFCDRCSLLVNTTRKLLYIVADDQVFDLPFECKQNWDQLLRLAVDSCA